MDKPGGPLTMLLSSRKYRCWVVAALIGIPILYVATLPLVPWCFAKGIIPPGSRREMLVRGYCFPANLVFSNCPEPIQEWVGWYSGILAD